MDDGMLLILIMCASFISVPLWIRIVRAYRKRFPIVLDRKKKRTLRQRLAQYVFHETMIGTVLDVTQVGLSLVSCAVYVVETYLDTEEEVAFFVAEVLLTIIFGGDYCFRFYLAQDKWVYFFDPFAVIDFITVVPALLVIVVFSGAGSFGFLRVLRLLRALRVLRILKILRIFGSKPGVNSESSTLTVQALKVCFTALCLIFGCACFFAMEEGLDFHVAFYFMTIETLGRPNIPCQGALGYMLLYSVVIVGYIFLPKQLADLSATWANNREYSKPYNAKTGRGHIIMCGSITFQVLRDTLEDIERTFILSPRNDLEDVVVLHEAAPSRFIASLVESYDCSALHQGNMLEIEALERVSVTEARFVLLFADSSVKNEYTEDFLTLSRFMALKAAAPVVPVCVLVLHKRFEQQLITYPSWNAKTDNVVCWATSRFGMLIANCVAPGTSTLITNLFSSEESDDITQSTATNLQRVQLDQFSGISFQNVVSFVYEHFNGAVLFGLETPTAGLTIHPSPTECIEKGSYGFCVCSPVVMDAMQTPNTSVATWQMKQSGGPHNSMMDPSVVEARQQPLKEMVDDVYGGDLHQLWSDATHLLSQPTSCDDGTADKSWEQREGRIAWRNLYNKSSDGCWCRSDDVEGSVAEAQEAEAAQHILLGEGHVDVMICGWDQNIAEMLIVLLTLEQSISVLALVDRSRVEKVLEHVQTAVGSEACNELLRIFQGSPTDETMLLEAGMSNCGTVVVLAQENFFETGLGDDVDDFLQDTDGVATFNLIQCHAPDAFIIIELQDTNSCVLLNDKISVKSGRLEEAKKASTNLHELVLSPEFKCGVVFVPALVHMLLVQALVLPSMMQLFKAMMPRVVNGTVHAPFKQVPVPLEMVGASYGQFFHDCLAEQDVVLLGLFSAAELKTSFESNVLMNPPPGTILKENDYAYGSVLKKEQI